MTNEQIKSLIETAKANGANADSLAKLEVAIRFFTDPTFAKKLSDFSWKINN